MARPRIKPERDKPIAIFKRYERLTVNVALSLVRLRDEKIGYMSSNMILVADCISTEHLLKSETISL